MDTTVPIVKDGGQNVPFGAVERKIARRYLGAKKSEGGVAVIAWISFICIMLAITAMITIMSIMNGFRQKVLDLTLGTQGHVYVGLWTSDIPKAEIKELERKLAGLPGVESSMEISENYAGFMANDRILPGNVIGLSKDGLANFKIISENLKYGSLQGFGQGKGAEHQIIMGSFLAGSMGLTAGDRVRIMTARTRSNAFAPPTPISKVYTVGGIFESGLYLTDTTTVYMEIEQSQLLFNEGKKKGEIQLRLEDADQVDRLLDPIRDIIKEPILLETWKDKNHTQVEALRTEQVAMRMIFVIVVIISVFPILAAMLMLVKNKSKDIAILRTIGATRGSILRIFFVSGTIIGFIGTLVGLILGVLICLNIETVQKGIEVFTGPLFPPNVYQITGGIPAKVVWKEVLGVALCGFIISAIATFFPALGASKTDPVDALRYD